MVTADSTDSLGLSAGLFVVLLLALALGGGPQTGSWAEAFVQLVSLGLLGGALLRLGRLPVGRLKWPLGLVALILALPLFQLIPLPPVIWTELPGRDGIVAAYQNAGISLPLLPVSLDPGATLRSFFTLLPPAAIFLATAQASARIRERVTVLLLVFAFVSAVLGLAQVAQGPSSSLRPYSVTNPSEAVGLFANRNHYAALLYAMIPMAGAWAIWLTGKRHFSQIAAIVLVLVVLGGLVVGIGIARSRAGVILAFVALVITLAGSGRSAATDGNGGRTLRFLFLGGVIAAVLVTVQLTAVDVLGRFETDVANDLRGEMAQTTWRGIGVYFPLGSGFGSFPSIYAALEGIPSLRESYVNHAHNDYLELTLEGGVASVVVLALFLAWFAPASIRAWRRAGIVSLSGLLSQAATISIPLLMLHSAADYPLRMTALACLFAFFCGLLVLPPAAPARPEIKAEPSSSRGAFARLRR